MKTYDKYKDSGIEWIGEIPEHWEEIQLGRIGKFSSSGINKKISEDELEVKIINYTDVYGNSKFYLDDTIDYMVVTDTENKIREHSVNKGDLIFTPSSETIEDIGVSAVVIEDLENTAFSYHVLRYQFDRKLDLHFKKYLCNNNFVLNYFSKNAQGTTRQTLDRNDFKKTTVLIPPFQEQTAIASYLDQKTAEIDQLITDKKRLLELYEEEKTAIINQAVTKGINPDVKMKDSGIEWLGEIPEHWEVKRLKYLAFLRSGNNIVSEQIKDTGNYPVFGGNGLRGYFSDFTHDGNFILIGRQGAYCGNIKYGIGKFWASEHAVVLTPLVEYEMKYIGELLRTMNLNQYSVSAAQPGLAVDTIKNLSIPVPPFSEQQSIVHYIETETARIDAKIGKTKKLIDLLSEYRTALISEVVTGKVKVCG